MGYFKKIKDSFGRLVDTVGDVKDHLTFWNDEFERDDHLDDNRRQQRYRNNINNFYNELPDDGSREFKRFSALRLLDYKAHERHEQRMEEEAWDERIRRMVVVSGPSTTANPLSQITGATEDFLRNHDKMKKADRNYGDKYFHCKANCQATKHGPFGRAAGVTISEGREFTDSIRNPLPKWLSGKELSFEENVQDIAEDQEANRWGRDNAHNDDCSEVCKRFRWNIPREWW